jgi:thymidine kinase
MAKLYFKYGAMGSSKTANALITKFNYEERGMKVWLIKPSIDDRDGADAVRSRIGLEAQASVITPDMNVYEEFSRLEGYHVIIADECQFFTTEQIDQLRRVVDTMNIPVLCFGLRTDFLTHMFEGSRRLFEVADSITEIKTICTCGKKAIVNARIDGTGRVVTIGGQIMLGGNDSYVAMCHSCWKQAIEKQRTKRSDGE